MEAISHEPTLSEQVRARVRNRIIGGDDHPREPLVEFEFAARLDVGRTSVSNAIITLEERGSLEEHGGKSAMPRLSLKAVMDSYRCRLALDAFAIRPAAEANTEKELSRREHQSLFDAPTRRGPDLTERAATEQVERRTSPPGSIRGLRTRGRLNA